MNKYQDRKDLAISLLESNCKYTAPEVIEDIDKNLQELIDRNNKNEEILSHLKKHIYCGRTDKGNCWITIKMEEIDEPFLDDDSNLSKESDYYIIKNWLDETTN